jgi:hypothetical protein
MQRSNDTDLGISLLESMHVMLFSPFMYSISIPSVLWMASNMSLGGSLDDLTNGSQTFAHRGDLMQDSQAGGVKKRKVVTPVAVCYSPSIAT